MPFLVSAYNRAVTASFPVTVISDYVCPWCYIVSARVERMEQEWDVDVRWWPFELHPETPPEGRPVDELLRRMGRGERYRQHLREYAAAAGLPLVSTRWLPNSNLALQLAEFARDRGRFAAVHAGIFRAYFAEGRNIGDPEVLEEVAAQAGLDVREWRAARLTGEYALRVAEATRIAREKGFHSTPTMILGNRLLITGAQEYDVYADALRRLGARRKTVDDDGVRASEAHDE